MTWEELDGEVAKLGKKINYKPDIIVGITRGGIIPARLLSNKLVVKEMYCLTIKKSENARSVASDITENIAGKNVLILQDKLETGKSLIETKRYLEQKGAIVKTASLYTMPTSEIKPDFSLREVDGSMNFPWEQEVPTPLSGNQ